MGFSLEELEERLLIGSTLVEGSTLTEAEARELLAGRTISGHPVYEVRELVNYRGATEWLLRQVQASPYVSVDLILGFHRRLLDGLSEDAGRLKSAQNFTVRTDGRRHAYVHPGKVPEALRLWTDDFNHGPSRDPAGDVASLYARFQAIHPFADGNGRIGRVLIAYGLHRRYALSLRFSLADKLEHLRAIEATDDGDLEPMTRFFRERIEGER